MVSSTLYTNFFKNWLKRSKSSITYNGIGSQSEETYQNLLDRLERQRSLRIGIVLSTKANTDIMDNKFMNFYSSLCL